MTHQTIPGMPSAWAKDYGQTMQPPPISEPASVPIEMACFAPSPGFEPRPKLAWLLRRLGRIWG